MLYELQYLNQQIKGSNDPIPLPLVKAFPTAYGGGAAATGGRGGNVYHVTNLDNSNSGSFRWAVTQPRPATIVFDVSGTILLTSSLNILGDNITISGQSAPQGGITITTSSASTYIKFGVGNNRIVRFLRIRPQDSDSDSSEIAVFNGTEAYGDTHIFDHCSLSYGGDEAFSIRGRDTNNITFQRGILAESAKGSLMGDIGSLGEFSRDNSFMTSLFYNISHRTPNVYSKGRTDIINNVIYNWSQRLSNAYDAQINHINNYCFNTSTRPTGPFPSQEGYKAYVNMANEGSETLDIYTSGNIIQDHFIDVNADNKPLWYNYDLGTQSERLLDVNFTTNRHSLIGITNNEIMTALDASIDVVADCGTNKFLNEDGTFGIHMDAPDTDYVNNVQNGVIEPYDADGAVSPSDPSKTRHTFITGTRYSDFQATISSTPVNTRPASFYLSNAHIPEVWFQQNVPSGKNHNDTAPNGYTYLENYLNEVDK